MFFLYLAANKRPIVPDEGSYAQTICAFNESLPSLSEFSYYLSWGPLFLLPSQFFNLIGLDCLTATRFTNLLFSLASGFIFLALIHHFKKYLYPNAHKSLPTIVVSIFFLFLPSKFLWTSIGIREAVIEFLSIFAVFVIIKCLDTQRFRHRNILMFILFLTLVILSLTRWMLALCLMGVFALFLLYKVKQKTTKHLFFVLIFSVLSSFFAPYLITQAYSNILEIRIERKIILFEKEISESFDQQNSLGNSTSQKKSALDSIEHESRISGLTQELKVLGQSKKDIPLRTYIIPDPEDSRVVRTLDARSQLPAKLCISDSTNALSAFVCNVAYLPIGLYSILLRPNPIQDWYSITTKLASIENFVYLGFLFWLSFLFFRRLREKNLEQISLLPLIFLASTIAGLALYEGNVGTAFRHRSITVWAICLALFLSVHKDRTYLQIKASFSD